MAHHTRPTERLRIIRLGHPTDQVNQVLALFAADCLAQPASYENDLSICDVCGAVSFHPAETSRRGCIVHPFGSYDGPNPPSSLDGARRITVRT